MTAPVGDRRGGDGTGVELDLAAIGARAEAATAAPWHAFLRGPLSCSEVWRPDPEQPDSKDPEYDGLTVSDALTDADADFIAHARTDVPALLARVRELEAAEARVRRLQSILAVAPDANPRAVAAHILAALDGTS